MSLNACARLGVLLATASLALAPSVGAAAPDNKVAEITPYDVLGRAGRAVELKIKLERKGMLGINPDVSGEAIDFFLVRRDAVELSDPEYLGAGETDSNGIAVSEWKPGATGQFVVQARIRRGSEYMALPADLVVAVPPADRAVILVQIDETVSKATNVQMFRGTDNAQIAAVDGSQAALLALTSSYQVVYLTDLEASFTGKFKEWLELREMPQAPVIFWELFERSLSHETYMKKLVAKLRQDVPGVAIGIGGHEADGRAYVEAGLAGIVVTDSPDKLDLSVVPARRWGDVLGHVAMLHRTRGLMADLAGTDPAKAEAALTTLSSFGRAGVGYVHHFRQDRDANVASAADLVTGKLLANEAFLGALDRHTANGALNSLLAAWQYGERGVVQRLYKDREAGSKDPIPSFRRIEMVSRTEPEPGKVVFVIRLLPAKGEAAQREVVFVRDEATKTWRVDVEAF